MGDVELSVSSEEPEIVTGRVEYPCRRSEEGVSLTSLLAITELTLKRGEDVKTQKLTQSGKHEVIEISKAQSARSFG